MKRITFKKYRPGWRTYLFAGLGTVLIFFGLMYSLLMRVNTWYDGHELVFNRPVSVIFKKPVEVQERVVKAREIIQIVEKIPEYDKLETPIEKYICDKWGAFECKTAIAIARAESGLRENAFNINTNDTFDYGIFQVNSIHHSKPGCSMKDLVDQYKNVDCAYTIWQGSGWSAWSVFNNGKFVSKL